MTAPTPRDELAAALVDVFVARGQHPRYCGLLADAALAHLAERLGSEALREAVALAFYPDLDECSADFRKAVDARAEVAVTAVRAALVGSDDE